MITKRDESAARELLRLRISQMIINEGNKQKLFKCPVHLALGHEAIAVALAATRKENDRFLLTHRNLHYNLALSKSLKKKIDEYRGSESGEAGGKLGCMNLYNEAAGVIYTSSILGNQMAVAVGVALANRIRKTGSMTVAVIGDGAIEEGIFQESLLMMRTYRTPALVIVENNGWSLATQIHERRCEIKLDLFSASLGIPYLHLGGNDVYEYIPAIEKARRDALTSETPVVVEITLTTLGHWRMKTEDHPDGKFINYHAGAAPNVDVKEWPAIEDTDNDPVHVLSRHFASAALTAMSQEILADLRKETA